MSPYPLAQLRDKKILVVGDLMLDRYWFGEVDRISPEAPVPVVRVAKRDDRLGGAANVARNVMSLGAQASLVGVVGVDEAGKKIQLLADDEGINAHLALDRHISTTLKMRIMGRQQQLLRVDFEYEPSEQALQSLYDHVHRLLPEHDVVVLSDYNKGALRAIEPLIALAQSHQKPVLVDPKGNDYAVYHHASLLTPNTSEMRQAVGEWANEQELEHKAQQLIQRLNLEALLVTRSEQGMSLYTASDTFHQSAEAKDVFDVSGAGDTVLATMAVTIAAGLSWPEAVRWANKAGGIVVAKLGTSCVTAQELMA